jgi:AcrR family transcriptional regulator
MKSNVDIRAVILETAEVQFAGKGYEGTSVRDIADSAGVNSAVIYYHFKSKELLYKALFNVRLTQLNNALEQHETDASWSSCKKLDSYLNLYIKLIKENFYFHRLLNGEIFSFRDLFFKMNIRASMAGHTATFRHLIQEGIDRKEFRPVDIDLFIMTLFHLLHQVVGRSPLISEILSLEEFPEEEMLHRVRSFLYELLWHMGLRTAA